MHVITVEIPHLGNRSHLVHDNSVAVVIDPPRDISVVESAASEAGVDIVAVAETHIHDDYVSGGLVLSRRHRADYLVAAEEDVEFDRLGVQDHDSLSYGAVDLRVLATPGHTPLHVSFLASDADAPEDAAKALFSGGSLLEGSVGRTDLVDPALTTALTRAQWRTARRLGALPSQTRLHPTHGPGSFCSSNAVEATDGSATIGSQLAENPALNTPCGRFMNRLLARPGPVPAHFARMTPRNRRGAWTPRANGRLGAGEVGSAVARGAQVVDIRSREKYAAGHVPGSIAVEHGPHLAAYAGWVTPWGSEIVLVSDSEVDLDLAERSSPPSASRASPAWCSTTPAGRAGGGTAGSTGRPSLTPPRRRTGSCSTYADPRSGAPATSSTRCTFPSRSSHTGSRRFPPARSGCTARPASGPRSLPGSSTEPVVRWSLSTTTSQRCAGWGYRSCADSPLPELRGPVVRSGTGPRFRLRSLTPGAAEP